MIDGVNMYDKAKLIIDKLYKKGKYISTMESCTGGGLVNTLTSIEGASNVLKYSAVTYSNEFKIKMGVDKKVIEKKSQLKWPKLYQILLLLIIQ